MADVKIADQCMIAVIAGNRERGMNGDAEPYCHEHYDSLPFHRTTIDVFLDGVNVILKFK